MNKHANASAKPKELQCHTQADTIAAHLLFPLRTKTFFHYIWTINIFVTKLPQQV